MPDEFKQHSEYSQLPALPKVVIPDLRFEESFARSIKDKSATAKVAIILKDMVVMPLIQGTVLNLFLLATKPYLRAVMRSGYNYGQKMVRVVNGLFSSVFKLQK